MVNWVSYRNVVHHAKGNKNARGILYDNLTDLHDKMSEHLFGHVDDFAVV